MDIKDKVHKEVKLLVSCLNVGDSDIRKIINSISNEAFEPQIIERKIEADASKLFDCNIEDVITYLSSYKDCKLWEEWSGYEDNYFVFIKKDKETEDEVIIRLRDYVETECKNLSRQRSTKLQIKKKKEELQKEIDKLNKMYHERGY